ncbi:charged multivesicular body protein 1 [Tremella mesenterica]|uniref:Charged multivesicular body protein 1 n=1 Tax=Tremella mesenterica TaxID=5217 RepID=A0A4Q1BWU5_TREME|nr:charged multivesicular body protein 1 [Tremella mesenterica]
MSHLEKSLFQLKFTAKSLQRQAKKANKDEATEKNKLKQALQKGNTDGARIYAQNAIRKKTEGLNLLRLASRIDAVASRVETAVTMRTVTNSMGQVISMVMDKFESQFADLDVQTGYMESTMSDTTALTTPQDQVDALINRASLSFSLSPVADEAGLEIRQGLGEAQVPEAAPAQTQSEAPLEEDGRLAERLRALRVSHDTLLPLPSPIFLAQSTDFFTR